MKHSRIALAAMVALGMVSQAQAVDLTVKGEITPPACNIQMVGGGVLDFGSHAHSTLSASAFTLLPGQDATLNITCTGASTGFAVHVDDTMTDSAQPGGGGDHNNALRIFGIGKDPVNSNKLGNFTMEMKSGKYGGTNATRWSVGSRGTDTFRAMTFGNSADYWSAANASEEYSILENSTSTRAVADSFDFTWNVVPALNTKANITSTENVPFLGMAKLTVRYL